MIGLGSNRLSVCRRGGMRVTQAGKGGMEWLAGGRDPIWASPYSAQATAALKAQFPTQWPTIRDYGFAHPEIVGYMNAYAPEDAKIAYSLVPTLNVIRSLDGDGTAYINTGFVSTANTEIGFKFYLMSYGTNAMGRHTNNSNMSITPTGAGKLAVRFNSNGYVTATNAPSPSVNQWLDIRVSKDACTMNGSAIDYAKGTTNSNLPIFLFGLNADGTPYVFQNKIAYGEFKNMADGDHYLVPFVRDNKNGMLDLLTGIFYPNANSSGSFTISESPAS